VLLLLLLQLLLVYIAGCKRLSLLQLLLFCCPGWLQQQWLQLLGVLGEPVVACRNMHGQRVMLLRLLPAVAVVCGAVRRSSSCSTLRSCFLLLFSVLQPVQLPLLLLVVVLYGFVVFKLLLHVLLRKPGLHWLVLWPALRLLFLLLMLCSL
jgi:hypothetical protein